MARATMRLAYSRYVEICVETSFQQISFQQLHVILRKKSRSNETEPALIST